MIAWLALAVAAPLPGRAVVAPPASDALERLAPFAADPSLFAPPVDAALHVGHDGGDLIVSAGPLPPGLTVEISVLRDGAEIGFASFSDPGPRRVDLVPPAAPGEVLDVHLDLVDDQGNRYTWTPAGRPDVRTPVPLLVAPAPGQDRPVAVDVAEDLVTVSAPGATSLSVVYDPIADKLGREIERGAPWRADAAGDTLAAPLPGLAGWFDVEARWTDDNGVPTDLKRLRIHHSGATSEAFGDRFHPAPLLVEPGRGRGLDLHDARGVCATDGYEAAAVLLSEEAERLLGVDLPVVGCDTAAVHLVAGPTPPDGFDLEVTRRRATVTAGRLRGAVYGALALVDAADPDGRLAPIRLSDAPELDRRWLFWRYNARHHKAGFPIDTWRAWVRRVVARGRYNGLILAVRDGVLYDSHPEMARRGALPPDVLAEVLDAAQELDLDVIPGLNTPAHAEWLLNTHPELAENGSSQLVCTRHPALRPLLADLMDELLAAFADPRTGAPPIAFHLGADEVRWRSPQYPEAARCPRCLATPPAVLYGDHVRWEAERLLDRGVTPIVWGDMLLPGWNGRREGLSDAVDRWPRRVREGLLVLPWTGIGGGPDALAARGLRALHAMTGHTDVRRDVLRGTADRVDGSVLALFWSWPWEASARGWGEGDAYAFPQVVLAGWTAWRPALADVPIDPLLEAMLATPALHPGFDAALAGDAHPLEIPATDVPFPAVVLPPRATVAGAPFTLAGPAVATPEAPLSWTIDGRLEGVAVLQAAHLSRDAHFARIHERVGTGVPVAVGHLEIVWADGETTAIPWRYGRETDAIDGPVARAALFDTAGTLRLASPDLRHTDPRGRDRTLHRVDWINPTPERPIHALRIAADRPGVRLGVFAVTAVR